MSTLLHSLDSHVGILPARAIAQSSSGFQRRLASTIVRLKVRSRSSKKEHHLQVAIQGLKAKHPARPLSFRRFSAPPTDKPSRAARRRFPLSLPSSSGTTTTSTRVAAVRLESRGVTKSIGVRARAHGRGYDRSRGRVRDASLSAPVRWPGSMLFVDVANGACPLARLPILATFAAARGCHALAMVEGVERTRQAPPGIYLIRADPMKRPDVGDDALVEYMNRAIDQGIPASDCILVTDDRALRGRMRIGVEKRKNSWLHSELQGFSGSVTWHRQLSPTPTRAARRENQVKWENRVKWRCLAPRRREHCRQEPRPVGPSAAPRDCQHHVQKAPPVEQSSWWHGWFASLRSLFVGSRDENKSVTERR